MRLAHLAPRGSSMWKLAPELHLQARDAKARDTRVAAVSIAFSPATGEPWSRAIEWRG
jgi:hypothetical protein